MVSYNRLSIGSIYLVSNSTLFDSFIIYLVHNTNLFGPSMIYLIHNHFDL